MAAADSVWREIFVGRERELASLLDAFEQVKSGQGPCFRVIVGDSGAGKTRLVQEFYRRLRERHDPLRYWPDRLTFDGEHLWETPHLVGEVAKHYRSFAVDDRPMPYLWWGMRIREPVARHGGVSDVMTLRRGLEPHVWAFRQLRREPVKEVKSADPLKVAGKVAKAVVKEAVEPLGGKVVSAILSLADWYEARQKAEQERLALDSRAAESTVADGGRDDRSLWQRTADEVTEVMQARNGVYVPHIRCVRALILLGQGLRISARSRLVEASEFVAMLFYLEQLGRVTGNEADGAVRIGPEDFAKSPLAKIDALWQVVMRLR
jgi:GTPase SAR1 family protein